MSNENKPEDSDKTTTPYSADGSLTDIKKLILDEYQKGNIVVAGFEGLQVMPLKDFIKQPAEGMLYDLNRNEAVILTFISDPKWVNDYASAQVIRELKRLLDEKNN